MWALHFFCFSTDSWTFWSQKSKNGTWVVLLNDDSFRNLCSWGWEKFVGLWWIMGKEQRERRKKGICWEVWAFRPGDKVEKVRNVLELEGEKGNAKSIAGLSTGETSRWKTEVTKNWQVIGKQITENFLIGQCNVYHYQIYNYQTRDSTIMNLRYTDL